MKSIKSGIVKFTARILLIFSPLIIVVMFTNYFVDPGGLFKVSREEGIAKIFAKGLNVANASNYDERLLQKHYIAADKNPKRIIVLGSSRAMQIDMGNLGSNVFFNHSVSGATIEDFFSICEMYEKRNKLPDTLILSLDPWLLNKNNDQVRWQSLRKDALAFMNRMGEGEKRVDEFFYWYDCLIYDIERKWNLFSLSYFQIAIRYLVRHMPELIETWKMKKDYYATKLDNFDPKNRLDASIRISNGTIARGEKDISQMRGDVKAYASQNPVYSLGEFYELDKTNQRNFEQFIEYLQKKNTMIIFFLPPYHPFVYAYLINSTQYQIIGQVETYFRTIGTKKHITVIGSYDPGWCSLTEEDFYDGMHITREAMAKLSELIALAKTK
jgi:hypothetical protein